MEIRNDDVYSADVFQVLFDYEIARARRYPTPMSLIQIEMKFTAINEEAQRAAPQIFISTLNNHLRSVDIISRAGNMYKILLPNTDANGINIICERILSVFKNKFETPDGFSIAYSLQIGATFHQGGETMSGADLVAHTIEALKQSKQKGPNTCIILS
jgi:GGDEF domain-containing protein